MFGQTNIGARLMAYPNEKLTDAYFSVYSKMHFITDIRIKKICIHPNTIICIILYGLFDIGNNIGSQTFACANPGANKG